MSKGLLPSTKILALSRALMPIFVVLWQLQSSCWRQRKRDMLTNTSTLSLLVLGVGWKDWLKERLIYWRPSPLTPCKYLLARMRCGIHRLILHIHLLQGVRCPLQRIRGRSPVFYAIFIQQNLLWRRWRVCQVCRQCGHGWQLCWSQDLHPQRRNNFWHCSCKFPSAKSCPGKRWSQGAHWPLGDWRVQSNIVVAAHLDKSKYHSGTTSTKRQKKRVWCGGFPQIMQVWTHLCGPHFPVFQGLTFSSCGWKLASWRALASPWQNQTSCTM